MPAPLCSASQLAGREESGRLGGQLEAGPGLGTGLGTGQAPGLRPPLAAGTGPQCGRGEESPAAFGGSRATSLSVLCAPSRLLSLSGPRVLHALMTITAPAVGLPAGRPRREPRTLSRGNPSSGPARLGRTSWLSPAAWHCPRQAGTPPARDPRLPDRHLHLGASQPSGSPASVSVSVTLSAARLALAWAQALGLHREILCLIIIVVVVVICRV